MFATDYQNFNDCHTKCPVSELAVISLKKLAVCYKSAHGHFHCLVSLRQVYSTLPAVAYVTSKFYVRRATNSDCNLNAASCPSHGSGHVFSSGDADTNSPDNGQSDNSGDAARPKTNKTQATRPDGVPYADPKSKELFCLKDLSDLNLFGSITVASLKCYRQCKQTIRDESGNVISKGQRHWPPTKMPEDQLAALGYYFCQLTNIDLVLPRSRDLLSRKSISIFWVMQMVFSRRIGFSNPIFGLLRLGPSDFPCMCIVCQRWFSY